MASGSLPKLDSCVRACVRACERGGGRRRRRAAARVRDLPALGWLAHWLAGWLAHWLARWLAGCCCDAAWGFFADRCARPVASGRPLQAPDAGLLHARYPSLSHFSGLVANILSPQSAPLACRRLHTRKHSAGAGSAPGLCCPTDRVLPDIKRWCGPYSACKVVAVSRAGSDLTSPHLR